MNAPILVTGGTGTIGRSVVPMLRQAGRDVRILTRHPRANEPGVQHMDGDTVSGRGLAEALDGVEVVLHLAGGAKGDDIAARNLATAAKEATAQHLILISVIGADRMPIGYFRAKAGAERAIVGSGVPWTVLRAAQLHGFVLPIVRGMTKLPFLPTPGGLRFEPVDVDEVAARLTELALGAPAGRVADIAGPEVLDIRQLADAYADATGVRPRHGLPVRIPGAIGRAYRAADNLAGEHVQRGTRTWRQFVSELAAADGTRGMRGGPVAAA